MRCSGVRLPGICTVLLVGLAGPLRFASPQQEPPNTPAAADDLERLRAMLQRSGPDGKEERESAVARLMVMSRPEAHRLLHEQLLRKEDPDGLRATILEGLQRHLLGNPPAQFGGAADATRLQILTGYLGACAPFWRGPGTGVGDTEGDALRAAARIALQRVPARDLDGAARRLLLAGEPKDRVDVLHCLADMQQTVFAKTIAEQLDAADETVRDGAQHALQQLVYPDQPIRSTAEFDAWHARFGSWRYIDLVERAARLGPRPVDRLRQELTQLRVETAREVVTALVVRTPSIDWAAVQARTVVEERAVLDACLDALQAALPDTLPPEDNPAPRQAFCRALLARFQQVPNESRPELQRRRVLLLGVAASLARPEETELANEVVALLLAQLDGDTVSAQVGALRGLRRFPSAETRALLVQRAKQLLAAEPPAKEQLQAILDALASRTAPRWVAPSADSPDKADWLALVDACCRSAPELELRARALLLAQTLDAQDARVPEVFGLLLALVRDPALETKYRSTCLIYLQAWRSDDALGDRWVAALQALLEDPATELRAQAAESLTHLPESNDARRGEWFASTIAVLRDRLLAEPDARVLRGLAECVGACGREPKMPEKAIGALRYVLDRLGQPVPAEQQFRLDPLLQALATIAADPRADRGQWLAACAPLLANGKRQSLRLILQNQAAVDLAKDVTNADGGTAERARRALRLIIETAVLKPPREAWTSAESLQREARDVRTAFAALDALEPAQRLDQPAHRLLRLDVELAGGKYQEVVQRATAWLTGGAGNGNGGAEPPAGSADWLDRVRLLAAEAQLALSRPDAALKLLEERNTDAAADPAALDLLSRIATALAASTPPRAVELFERAMRATAPEDPAFRRRLLDWLQQRLRVDPDSRVAVARDADRHAALFEAPDCPPELRELFEQMRAAR